MTPGPPTPASAGPEELDPFDLPDWLADGATWSSDDTVLQGSHVAGRLCGGDAAPDHRLACDLLAVDCAYPRAVLPERWRTLSHRLWVHGQVAALDLDGRLTLAVPASSFTADLVLEAVGRFARAVGAAPERYVVALRPR